MLLSSHYDADLINKPELRLMVVSALCKIKFGHAQISVPKMGMPMWKISILTSKNDSIRGIVCLIVDTFHWCQASRKLHGKYILLNLGLDG